MTGYLGQEWLPLVWERQPPTAGVEEHQAEAHDQTRAMQRWVGQVSAGVAEVAGGQRPARQLFTIMTPGALDRLQRRAAIRPSGNGPIRKVLSVRLNSPTPGTLEAAAVVEGTRHCQAVALQLRRRRSGWLVTAAEIR